MHTILQPWPAPGQVRPLRRAARPEPAPWPPPATPIASRELPIVEEPSSPATKADIARFAVGIVALCAVVSVLWLAVWAVVAPPILGWSSFAVTSGSMSPKINTGDIVISSPYTDQAIGSGTVIVFEHAGSEGPVTHRIFEVTESGAFRTRGDANRTLDSSLVEPSDVLGVGRLVVPWIGKPFASAAQGDWMTVAIIALLGVGVLWLSRWGLFDEFDPWRRRHRESSSEERPGSVRSKLGALALFVVAALLMAAIALTTAKANAGYVDSTDNAGNSFASGSLQPPTGLAAVGSGSESVDLTWTPTVSAFADGYNLSRSLVPGSGYTAAATVPGQPTSSHTDTGLQPGNINYYVADAYAGGWTSTSSNEASALTAGYPGAQQLGTWGTGLAHPAEPGADRGLIFITGNEQDPHVRLLGNWGTGLTHVAEPGVERALVFIAGHEHGTAPAPTLSSVTYGGQALQRVNGVSAGTGITARVEIWVLDAAGIAAASDSTFVPTWSSAPDLPMYSHAFFAGVNQATPVVARASNFSDVATPNPITTAALPTTAGFDYVIAGAVAGNNGSYAPQNGFTLGNNQNAGATATLGTAVKRAVTGTETPSMQHSGPNRQAIAGIVLNASETPFAPTVTSVTYGGQPMTKVTSETVGSLVTAATEIWFLDEAGISAATDGTFVPTWDSAPDLFSYSHRFYSDIDQADPIGATGTGSSAAATPNPITTTPLTTFTGDIVVTGAVAGESGTYTPQNGFTIGNNQNAGTSTLGTADKIAGASSETPSMQHSGPNRQAIAGAVLNRRRTALSNGWTTGLTHIAGSGNDRLLVFVAGMENGAAAGTPPDGLRELSAVTYGGQALTQASDVHICTPGAPNSFCARTELWYLLESGIAAATDSTFVPTWTGDTPYELEELYAAVTFERVDQIAPIGNISTNSSTANPIQPTHPVGVGTGDISIVAVMGGMQGTYTPPATYTEATDETLLSSVLATAYIEVSADGTQQPSMSFDGTINRQAVLAATIKTTGTP